MKQTALQLHRLCHRSRSSGYALSTANPTATDCIISLVQMTNSTNVVEQPSSKKVCECPPTIFAVEMVELMQ
jgi:hypothetical protein